MAENRNRPDTVLATAGRRKNWRGRLVNVPVHRGSTILFDSIADVHAATPGHASYYYGLHGTPSQWALAEALTELEPGAAGTILFPTGLAAVTTALLSVLSAGDELLVTDSVYWPTRFACDRQLKRFGITTRFYDPGVGGGIADLIGERTRAVLMESPGSLTMDIQDVPAIVAVCRERGIKTLLDNTWATPLFFPAMAAGVDLSILAATKYVGGHADLLLGSVTANPDALESLERTSWDLGHAASPDDCFLALRGLRTMAVRLQRHQASAIKVARWLLEQPQVAQILHPAFEGFPGHDLWKRDFRGSSGLFSFVLKGGSKTDRDAVLDRLKLFGLGYSWGGFESLAVPADPETVRTATEIDFAGPLIRLHVALEDPDDLIADLAQALKPYPAR